MTKKPRLRPHSHDLFGHPQSAPPRWQVGYLAAPDPQPGRIRVTRAVAAEICHDFQQSRHAALTAAVATVEWYEEAIATVDSRYPQLYLDGEHLVADWRHVDGDSDSLRTTEPDPDGWYSIGVGFTWPPVTAARCDTVRDGSSTPGALILVSAEDLDAATAAHRARTDVTWRAETAGTSPSDPCTPPTTRASAGERNPRHARR